MTILLGSVVAGVFCLACVLEVQVQRLAGYAEKLRGSGLGQTALVDVITEVFQENFVLFRSKKFTSGLCHFHTGNVSLFLDYNTDKMYFVDSKFLTPPPDKVDLAVQW